MDVEVTFGRHPISKKSSSCKEENKGAEEPRAGVCTPTATVRPQSHS